MAQSKLNQTIAWVSKFLQHRCQRWFFFLDRLWFRLESYSHAALPPFCLNTFVAKLYTYKIKTCHLSRINTSTPQNLCKKSPRSEWAWSTVHMLLIILNAYFKVVYISIAIHKRAGATTPKSKIMCLWYRKKGKEIDWSVSVSSRRRKLSRTRIDIALGKNIVYMLIKTFSFLCLQNMGPVAECVRVCVFGNAYRHQKPEIGSKIYNIRYLNFSLRHQHTHTPNGNVNWIFS